MTWLILLSGLIITGLTGVPIGIGLALTGLTILRFSASGAESMAINSVWGVFTDFTLTAVPLFIFMGEILLVSGVSSRIYAAISPFFRRIPGGLLHSNIAVCTIFGAVSGASTSTAAAVGSVAYPELRRRKYSPAHIIATLAAGGTLGLLIPPSLSLLLYGATQGVSIGRLFLAGVVPGLMLALFFMSFIWWQAKCNPEIAGIDPEPMPMSAKLINLLKIWPIAFLVFAVMGTLYLGLATPTEAAGLGTVAAALTGFLWGSLTFKKLIDAFFTSARVFGSIALVMLGALVLAQSLTITGLPQQLVGSVQAMGLHPSAILLFVIFAYVVLGCFFDGISLMLMTIPIVYPLMMAAGYDPVWTGVVITILIEIGMITPPVGMNLFVLTAIANREVSLGQAAKASLPFWLLMLFSIFVLTIFPSLALWLPDRLMGQ